MAVSVAVNLLGAGILVQVFPFLMSKWAIYPDQRPPVNVLQQAKANEDT